MNTHDRSPGRPHPALLPALCLAFLLALLLVMPVTLAASPFPDVPAAHPYHDAIMDLASRGIITGYTDGTFGPQDPVLRQQFAKMIVLTGDYPVSAADTCPFTDVEESEPPSLYPDHYVAVAAARGITVGTSPGLFSPWARISRYQVISMVVRAADDLGPGLPAQPPEGWVGTPGWADNPTHGTNARRAEYNGLLAGLPLGTLDPWGDMPRGEVAQVLHNLIEKLAPATTTTSSTTVPTTTSSTTTTSTTTVPTTTATTTTTTEPSGFTPIAEIKGPRWESHVGERVTVEGIFVRDPVPMLVTNLEVVMANSRIPEDEHVVLTGETAESIDPGEYGGGRLRVTGRVAIDDPRGEPVDGSEHVVLADVEYQMLGRRYLYNPSIADIPIYLNGTPDPRRYAILFSGGIEAKFNHTRYWNDLKFMYAALVGPLGFSANNIAVLYADGNGLDTVMPVHYAATEANLATVFTRLRRVANADDTIFVFTTNHGGGFDTGYTGSSCLNGGGLDTNGDEPNEVLSEATYKLDVNGDGDKTDTFSWDEELCSWKGTTPGASGTILDDDLRTIFAGLTFDRMVIVMEQCFSGGLINDVAQGGNRIIMSAAGEHEPSWAMNNKDYDEFSYYFTCAVNGADEKGNPVAADTNQDGDVSLVEAFNYARSHDTQSETPWYEDSGDGIPHSGAMPGGGEGTLGGNTSLEP